MPKLTFLGAAQTVTGSKYLLEADGARVLVDCGLFQGLKELREKNWAPLPFEANSIDCVVLTHAHLDHVGYLPRLVNQGYDGPIFATQATIELTELILFDSAKIQEADADYANRKGFSRHQPALPLYDSADAARTVKRLTPFERNEWHAVKEPIWIRYHDAGHLLGSCLIEVEVRTQDPPIRLVFSGDVGRYDAPLYHNPQPPPACDYLICESTYGDREHPEADLLAALADLVNAVVRRGGVMLAASFAVGRAQQLIYLLQVLAKQNRIPELPIYLDSPMAVDATKIYCDYRAEHDLSEGQLTGPDCVFAGRNVHLSRTVDESKSINHVRGPAIIIASSGMMTSGRILHHLRQRLPEERHTVVLGGFQPEGTRGRQLEEGARYLHIHGRDVPVRAAVVKIPGLSGHADRSELLHWLAQLSPPKQTFLTHGEIASANALASELRAQRDWEVAIPRLGQTVNLE